MLALKAVANQSQSVDLCFPPNLGVQTPVPDDKLASSERPIDLYQLLSIPRDASIADIKIAYHRSLLQFHPDKRNAFSAPVRTVDISQIKDAYTTLSTPELRARYDLSLQKERLLAPGPRPAQVISLEEFEEVCNDDDGDVGLWQHVCRCGGIYKIAIEDMERGQHLIGCSSCSEVVWVGYELSEDEGEQVRQTLDAYPAD